MQEEVNEKTVALCIQATKLTARELEMAMRRAAWRMDEGRRYRNRNVAGSEVSSVTVRGKQTLNQLMEEGSQLTNIEITDQNIRSFQKVARKYGIDYSLKKDGSSDPPRYLVFFRAKDVDVMTAAFKEYSGLTLKKDQQKISIRKNLQKAVQRAVSHRERSKLKQKEKNQER